MNSYLVDISSGTHVILQHAHRFDHAADQQEAAEGVPLADEDERAHPRRLQGVGELGPAISELRDTLGALRGFSRRLEQDPTGYLLRNDSIKEFQP